MTAAQMTAAQDEFARQWLERQTGRKPSLRERPTYRTRARIKAEAERADRGVDRPATPHHKEAVSIYSVAIFKQHREASPFCLCDVCVKVRRRVSEQLQAKGGQAYDARV